MRIRRLLIVALGVAMFGLAVPVSAQNAPYGGNKASDYQPPTRNPQDNVATGIQTNNTNLQPTNTQAGVNQQNLAPVTNLQVTTTGQGAFSTASSPAPKSSNFWKYFGIDLAAIAVVAFAISLWRSRRKYIVAKEEVIEKPAVVKPAEIKKPKKKKSTKPNYKKKSRKRS